ncbi:hypothetical protein F5Y04DRAFT_258588 [Hypomontagnella monticulosa]|nr:hypothetical protein F5Y04DRAFT_258588 [Hypomontagnella monticulosa]
MEVEIATLVGGGATYASVEHRMRPIKQLSKMQRWCVEHGEEPGDLPTEKSEIQKLFGESTAMGIEWQFRDYKALARAQQEALAKGEDTAKAKAPPKTRKGQAASTPASGKATSGSKRKRAGAKFMSDDDTDHDGADSDYDAKDVYTDEDNDSVIVTPTPKRPNTGTSTATTAGASKLAGITSSASASSSYGTSRNLFPGGTRPVPAQSGPRGGASTQSTPRGRPTTAVADDSDIEITGSSKYDPIPRRFARASRVKDEQDDADETKSGMGSFTGYRHGGSSFYSGGGDDEYFDDGEA